METPTPQQWQNWQNHQSNKEKWIDEKERQDETCEDGTCDVAPSEAEFEAMTDCVELNAIIARRGLKWLWSAIGETAKCADCGIELQIKKFIKKKQYAGTDFKEDSPINYPTALFCPKCYGKN
jgi:hypothetical protein